MTPDPVIIVGAGPIGLTTALGLEHHGVPFAVFEEDGELSRDTKAGTILTRTLEVFRRFGVADQVLQRALRVELIGDIDRASNLPRASIETSLLRDETRYPFVINLPQHHLEPILADALGRARHGSLNLRHRMVALRQAADHVEVDFAAPDGVRSVRGSYVLACDGGRSSVRRALGIATSGFSLDVRYMLVDVVVDLDVLNPRDYPYLAYFADPVEWMILVRHPHCWRFLFPLPKDAPEPGIEELRAKVLHFIGETSGLEVIGRVTYAVHHRVADAMAARPGVPDGRRCAPDHPDVGAGPEYRRAGREQPAVAVGLGASRLGGRRVCWTGTFASNARSRCRGRARWQRPRAAPCRAARRTRRRPRTRGVRRRPAACSAFGWTWTPRVIRP